MKDNRKKWISPQLIVLGRGTPEENVLAGCKTSKLSGSSVTKTGCKKNAKTTNCGTTKCSVTTAAS